MASPAITPRAPLIVGAGLFFAAFLLGAAQSWRDQGVLPPVGEDALAQAKRAVERGEIAPAVAQLRMYALIEPRRPEGWVRLGQALAMTGDRAGAIDAFERGAALATVPLVAHQQLAALYLQAGRVDDARTQARIVRARGGELPAPLLRLADESGAAP